MTNVDIVANMELVKIVWIVLNCLLIIYAIILIIYGKCFRKSEIQSVVNFMINF
jgi:hypothetical protein